MGRNVSLGAAGTAGAPRWRFLYAAWGYMWVNGRAARSGWALCNQQKMCVGIRAKADWGCLNSGSWERIPGTQAPQFRGLWMRSIDSARLRSSIAKTLL